MAAVATRNRSNPKPGESKTCVQARVRKPNADKTLHPPHNAAFATLTAARDWAIRLEAQVQYEWPRVHQPSAGPVGLLEQDPAGLLAAGQAHKQGVHRVLQRPAATGVPQRNLVPLVSRCSGKAGGLGEDYNELRPHTSLGNLTTKECLSTSQVIQTGSAETIALVLGRIWGQAHLCGILTAILRTR